MDNVVKTSRNASKQLATASSRRVLRRLPVTVVGLLIASLAAVAMQSGCSEDNPASVRDKPSAVKAVSAGPRSLAESGEIRLSSERTWDQMDDSTRDGWDTESLHDEIKKQLKTLGQLLITPEEATAEALAPLLAKGFRGGLLRPAELRPVLEDKAIIVERGSLLVGKGSADVTEPIDDAESLSRAIQQLTGPLQGASETRHKFKVYRVDKKEGGAETEQFLSLSGRTSDGFFEQHATWITDWEIAEGSKPKLRSIRVTRFEQIRAPSAADSPSAGTLFVDCTESALGENDCYRKQILRGAMHWFDRVPLRAMLTMFAMTGVAVGDVNGDGLEDLYLCQDPGIPNRLFLQNRDGTASEVSKEWGVDWLEDSRGVLLVDLDNDGDQDLVVTTRGNVVIAENDEGKRFHVRTVLTPSNNLLSLSAFDYDGDGRLDLYVCGYDPDDFLRDSSGSSMGAARERFVVHDANDGAANSLFRNVTEPGDWFKFVDVTKETGLDVNNRRWTFSAVAEDYDNDGDQDLYVANDYGRDNLYRNDVDENGKRTFVDVSDSAGIEDSAGGMGMTWADYDRNGHMDAFISNMWSSAGQRITNQNRFKPGLSEEVRRRYQHLAEGNTLLQNAGDGTFKRRSVEAGVEMGRWAWGNRFLDLNNDGWEDLIVANGYMTTGDSGDL